MLESTSVWESYLDREPSPCVPLDPEGRDALALAFAHFADLKIPSKLGHSPAVAGLVERAARSAGFGAAEIGAVRTAALLHDIGVVGIPNGIWEKPGPLNVAEWERVRLHAYYTERVLSRVPALAPIAELASLHHERCDGSGYPRGMVPGESQRAARLLAAADVFQAMTEPRAHRAAMSLDDASTALREEARSGHLCANAVDCVLAAIGRGKAPDAHPATKITARESEVLVLLARGKTNKEIAGALGISAKTVQHHLAHVYEKVGVSTRAAAALFAVRNDLVSGS